MNDQAAAQIAPGQDNQLELSWLRVKLLQAIRAYDEERTDECLQHLQDSLPYSRHYTRSSVDLPTVLKEVNELLKISSSELRSNVLADWVKRNRHCTVLIALIFDAAQCMSQRMFYAPFDTSERQITGGTLLHFAAARGLFHMASVLIKYGTARVDARDGEGNTPLHAAINELTLHGDQQTAQMVVDILLSACGKQQVDVRRYMTAKTMQANAHSPWSCVLMQL